MSDISILPIFNQSNPNVWDDFLYIRAAAFRHSCGYIMTDKDYDDALKDFLDGWRRRKFNFAFGAYDDADMVGFIQGDCMDNVATIRSLYVLPEYTSQKIGSRLLKSAENAGAFGAKMLDLISLPRAQKFYERYNYTPIYHGSNHYIKDITNETRTCCSVVPVFKSTPSITRMCKRITSFTGNDFNPSHINVNHMPMFVYLDSDFTIQGFAISTPTDTDSVQIHIAPNQPQTYMTRKLNNKFNELKNLRIKSMGRNRGEKRK